MSIQDYEPQVVIVTTLSFMTIAVDAHLIKRTDTERKANSSGAVCHYGGFWTQAVDDAGQRRFKPTSDNLQRT